MPRQDADRNLLFGILALQMDFITRDALIAAMAAWVMEKHRPLGDILVEQKALDPIDRSALDPMIARHLAKHGGDPAASLAALSSIDTAASALRHSIADPAVLESLASAAPSRLEDSYATRSRSPFEPHPTGIRYHKVRDHAKGGLGVVFVARDEELNREVALKEIQDRHADDPNSRARFLIEAEVTGGLEHPGIVPVYGLGAYEDGRPFYAMRFIRGASLKHAIAAFHNDEALEADPGARTLELQKLLRRFLDVCNAIEYAHSRGVLHRDLKPDNVMIGKYGETLVVDWGLAKITGRSGNDIDSTMPETTLSPASSSGSNETLPGSVIGTPAYMSPEQAAGRLDLLGPTSDVYSLGATLYTLLTGHLPFTENELAEMLRKVERGDFPRPREKSAWLDPALEAVCLKSMALRLDTRYPSPRALAEDVERILADEPVTAYPEPFARRTRRWARKHRAAVTTAPVVAIVATILICGARWQHLLQVQKTDTAAMDSLAKADQLASVARATSAQTKWTEAIAEARRAEAQLESGGGSLSLKLKAQAKIEVMQAEVGRLSDALQSAARDARMLEELDEFRLQWADVKPGTAQALSMRKKFLKTLQDYGIDVETLGPDEVATRIRSSQIGESLVATLDEWLNRDLEMPDHARLESIARSASPDAEYARLRETIRRRDVASLRLLVEGEDARRKLGRRLRLVFQALSRLDPSKSLPILQAIQRENPSDFWFNHDLGIVYRIVVPPRHDSAIRCLTAAVVLRPKSAGAYIDLGGALNEKGGEADEAIVVLREALRLRPDDPIAYNNLGNALDEKGDKANAIAAYREAIRLEPGLGDSYVNLGMVSGGARGLDEGTDYRDSIRLRPDFTRTQRDLEHALNAKGEKDRLVATLREAVQVTPDDAGAHHSLGLALIAKGSPVAAARALREAIRLRPGYAESHCNLGVALNADGNSAGAIEALREAIRLRTSYAEAHCNLGLLLHTAGDRDGAIAALREAIWLKPVVPEAQCELGKILRRSGEFVEALEHLRSGHGAGSKQSDWSYPSAEWVHECERLVELEAKLPAVIRGQVSPKDVEERLSLAVFCYEKALYGTSARFYDEALTSVSGLGDDLSNGHRYKAACSAVLAGTGRGKDDPPLDDATRTRWRQKALSWLRADLAIWTERLRIGPPHLPLEIARELSWWRAERDLANIRDVQAISRLPESEREFFHSLWLDHEAIYIKARKTGGLN